MIYNNDNNITSNNYDDKQPRGYYDSNYEDPASELTIRTITHLCSSFFLFINLVAPSLLHPPPY